MNMREPKTQKVIFFFFILIIILVAFFYFLYRPNHQKIKQLSMGYEMGLGEVREEAIEILGEKIDNLQTAWKPAQLKG